MNYNFNSDNLEIKGFLSKEKILSLVSEEEIFELVFKFKPEVGEFVTSPFRRDSTPRCFFNYCNFGKLRFYDYGNSGENAFHPDCFDAVKLYFNLQNFYDTLVFIHNKLIKGVIIIDNNKNFVVKEKVKVEKKEIKIMFDKKEWDLNDKLFWQPYGISKANLIEDKVFATNRAFVLNTRTGSHVIDYKSPTYVYTDFENGRKKLYSPFSPKEKKFLTNCTENDIGGINYLNSYDKNLIITKSYKDYRVLKNADKNVIWFQNEGMLPKREILSTLVKCHYITVWFDNDQTGIKASCKISDKLNSIAFGKAKALHLPEKLLQKNVKDPSDLRKFDINYFNNFLKDFLP